MNERQSQLGRRRVLELAGAATVVGLAGCTDDESGNGDGNGSENGDENGDEENGTGNGNDNEDGDGEEAALGDDDEEILLFSLENEDGDPVSEGVTITVVPDGNDGMSYIVDSQEEMEGGEVEQPLMEPDDYHITVEGEDFEDVEETVTVEEGETEEVTLTLEGAPAEGDGGDEADGDGDTTDGEESNDTNDDENNDTDDE